jgi:hypothetical protein
MLLLPALRVTLMIQVKRSTHPRYLWSRRNLTAGPALVDKDERPDWLLISVREFLRHGPYYACLGKVVDLFLAQEARLGYPAKVSKSELLYVLHSLTSQTPTVCRACSTFSNRPTEIAVYMKNARDFSRGYNVDAAKFGALSSEWWLTIQPTTRKAWPPTYEQLPEDFSFDFFNRGGPNGVFLVISAFCGGLTHSPPTWTHKLVVHDFLNSWLFMTFIGC